MLSGFIKWAVKSYFEDLLEDVDCNQLSLGLLRGFVEFSDLTICKRGRILTKAFPLFIECGHVDSLTLKAPLKLFGDESWFLSLTNVSVHCSCKPLQDNHELLQKHKKDELARKLSELTRLEDCWKVESLGHAKIPWADLASSLLFQIIRNITLTVNKFQCSIAVTKEETIRLQADSILVERDNDVPGRCQKKIRITGLILSLEGLESSSVACGPIDVSAFADITSDEESPYNVSWRIDSPCCLNLSPRSYEAFSKLLSEIGVMAKFFQLREDSLLCPVANHAKLWWQHALWLVSSSCRKFSRYRLQRRLRQASLYCKAYYQWLKFEYVEIALKRVKEDVEISWSFQDVTNLRRRVLDKFLSDTKRLSEKDSIATVSKQAFDQPSRSSSQGWLKSMSSWVGLGRSNSQPDLQSDQVDLLPVKSTEEKSKWLSRGFVVNGNIEAMHFFVGSPTTLILRLANLASRIESSGLFFSVNSVELNSLKNSSDGSEKNLFTMRPASIEANALSVNYLKSAESVEIAMHSPILSVQAAEVPMLLSLVDAYPLSMVMNAASNFKGKALTQEVTRPLAFDLKISTPCMQLFFNDDIDLSVAAHTITFKSTAAEGSDAPPDGSVAELTSDFAGKAIACYVSTVVDFSLSSSFLEKKVQTLIRLHETSCKWTKFSLEDSGELQQLTNFFHFSFSTVDLTVCKRLLEVAAHSSSFFRSLPRHQSADVDITQSVVNTVSRRKCLRCDLPRISLTLHDEDKDMFDFTILNVEFAMDSASAHTELAISSICLDTPRDNLFDKVYFKGSSNNEEVSFLSFEANMAEKSAGESDALILSLTVADIETKINPQFIRAMLVLAENVKNGLSQLTTPTSTMKSSSTSMPAELVTSVAKFDLTLLPEAQSAQQHMRLTVDDFQALHSPALSWEVAVDAVELIWYDNDSTTLINSYSLPDSCFRLKFDESDSSLVVSLLSVDFFAPPVPLAWLICSYYFVLQRPSTNTGEQIASPPKGLSEVRLTSEKSRVCLEGDVELAVAGVSRLSNEHFILSNAVVKKLSTGLVLLDAPNIVVSTDRIQREVAVSVVKISSDKATCLSWNVMVENMLKEIIGVYSSFAAKVQRQLRAHSHNTRPSSKDQSKLEVTVLLRSLDLSILDPFDPKVEVVRCFLSSPSIKFAQPTDGEIEWECDIDAQTIRIIDRMYDLVMFEAVSAADKSGSRSGIIPMSSSYPGVLSGRAVHISKNSLLKPLPPVPDFAASLSTTVTPLFQVRVSGETQPNGHARRRIAASVEGQCSLAVSIKCLPTLLEAVGLGAKMFPVITVKDKFGRPMHKLANEIVPSPDVFNFSFSANSVTCRLFAQPPEETIPLSFVSAFGTDGVQLSFSSVPNVHRLDGSFSAASLQLFDDSKEHGSLYSCRALATGLAVDFSKAGLPDYDLSLFGYEVLANVSTETLSYVHTKRIFVSILDFVDALMQHRERLAKECAQRQNIPCQELPGHGARLDLKFAFKNPNLVVPTNYLSKKSLVLRCNETVYADSWFAWQGESRTNLCGKIAESSLPNLHPLLVAMKLHEPTTSDGSSPFPCLLNMLRFDLKGLNVFDGTWKATLETSETENDYLDFSTYAIEVERTTTWCDRPLSLVVHMERNLDGSLSRQAPDFSVSCLFDKLNLDISQEAASRIFGILDKNFGEDLGGPPQQEYSLSWKNIEVVLYAQECRVHLLDENHCELAGAILNPAALSFSRFSNNFRAIDYKWPIVYVSDIRSPAPDAHVPTYMACPIASLSDDTSDNNVQFEFSYSSNNNLVKIGCLLSHLRVVQLGDFWFNVVNFLTGVAKSQQNEAADVSVHSKALFAVGDDVVSRVPMPPQAVRRQSSSVKVSLHRSEFCYLLPSSDSRIFGSRGFLAETTAMLVMSPTRSLTLNIPCFKVTRLAKDDTAGDIVTVMTNFIGDISREQGSGSDSPASATSESRSVSHNTYGVLEVVLPPSDMRCEVSLGSLRVDLTPQVYQLISSSRQTQPASPVSVASPEPKSSSVMSKLQDFYPDLAKVKISVSLVACNLIIDATPVITVTLSDLIFEQNLFASLHGNFSLKLACRYHNAAVSNWEPLVETWGCQLSWRYDGSHTNELFISATSENVFNINITSGVLELWRWLQQMLQTSASLDRSLLPDVAASTSARAVYSHSVRPFILINKLELPLAFCVHQSELWSIVDSTNTSGSPRQTLLHVLPNQEQEFGDDFSPSSSLSLAVKIGGFQPIPLPIPIDAVGIVVRSSISDTIPLHGKGAKSPRSGSVNPTRIIFRITLNRRRQKVVYAESAVRLINRLPHGLALAFTDSSDDDPSGCSAVTTLDTGESAPLPLANLYKMLWFRPLKPGIGFCQAPVMWQSVSQPGLPENIPLNCHLSRNDSRPYHCVVSVVKRQSHFSDVSASNSDPWHVITISAPIAIRNLLPCDITFELTTSRNQLNSADRLQSGRTARLTGLDAESTALNLAVKTDQFPFCTAVSVMLGRSNLYVLDEAKRPLRLAMTTERSRHGVLVIRIECSFWLYNNTNLPLIFRQHATSLPAMDSTPYSQGLTRQEQASDDGHPALAAGQSQEYELARSVVPLMFSFDDEEWQFCQMRLGKALHYPALKPIWSQKFSLVGGTTTRWLFASSSEENYVPERCYVIGLEVEQGRGEYENTTFVTFTARYQIVNHTSHLICVAQHCLVAKCLPPFDDSATDGVIQVAPGSSMAFHWWRADADSLVSVRLVTDNCFWSGSFDINSPSSFHINMRDATGGCHLLHVEIITIGPMNCILLSDASITPPPYRIDNFSEVPLLFYQKGTSAERLKTSVNPKSSMAYALDEPFLPPKIVMSIVGGAASTGVVYDLNMIAEGEPLEYENFIYIQLENSKLVLDVAPDNRRVIFAPMKIGRRSQLWRMTSTGILQNEGIFTTGNVRCALDTEEQGIDPNRNALLCLRQQDDRRKIAQTWVFTDDGRLTSAPGSTLGVHGGEDAVAGPDEVRDAFLGPSPTKRIIRQRLRPGSGVLCVTVVSDGPTRVLRICDLRSTRSSNRHSAGLMQKSTEIAETSSNASFRFQLYLPYGIGISLVSATEELAYVTLKHVAASYRRHPPVSESIRLSISAIQIDNQLLSTPCLVLLFSDTRTKQSKRSRRKTTQSSTELATLAGQNSPGSLVPTLVVSASRLLNSSSSDVIVFKNLSASVSKLFIRLEERFLWKILQLFAFNGVDTSQPFSSTADRPTAQQQAAQDSRFAPLSHRFSHIVLGRRLYFASLSIRLNRLDLGMATASAPLPADLRRIKRAFRVPLIQFTGAQVELETFSRHHVLVTWPLLLSAINQHYSRQLRSQAGKIFGSVDFLGSPLGLFTDVTEGLSGLIRDANVSGLVRHVMHGLSNSTARFTSTLSETLGSVASDVHYQAERDLIRAIGPSARPSDHLVAGLVGFGHGVIGGVTSLFTHTYQGATQQGPFGLLTGLGRGVVGTVTRPAAGFLDLAAGAAKAVSETARTSTAPRIMGRVREPRCTSSLTGALCEYSSDTAEAQQFLFTFNSGRLSERLLAMECLVHMPQPDEVDPERRHRVAVLVTSDRVYIVRRYADPNSVLQLRYDTIRSCRVVFVNGCHHVELLFSRNLTPLASSSSDYSLLPSEMDAMALNAEQQRSGYLIRGTSEAASQRIAMMINYARQLHDRSRLFVSAATLTSSSDGCDNSEFSEFDP